MLKKPNIKLPPIKLKLPKLVKVNIPRKQLVTLIAILLVGVVSVLGRRSPFGNNWESVLPAKDIFDGTGAQNSDDDKYTAFFFEVYDLIMNNYWNKLSDEQLSNITTLAVQKVTEQEPETKPLTKNDTRLLLQKTMENMTDEEKKEFITKVADIVLANLEPFGRSRLYTSQKQQALSDTVKNIDPNADHYKALDVTKDATPEQVADAYAQKITELNQKEQTPEVQQEKAQVERAKEVLGDAGNKQVYDESGANPTIENRLISPRIAYIHITKFSPTTVDELNRVMEKYDQGDVLDTLIIDLRGNIGGAIDGLPYFLGPFIGQNQYAYQFFKRGEKQDFITKTGWLPSLVRYKKVVVLIDDQVQSSGEVFAATLKKYNVGTLVGVPTKGWGTVEAVFKINNQIDPDNETYSALLVHSLTLRDDSLPIEGRGVEPNVNINDANWQQELFKYFSSQELVNAVAGLVR